MADKPRVKAPKQRAVTADESAHRRKTMAIVAGGAGLVLGFVVVAAALGMFGGNGGTTDVAGLRTTLKGAGCSLQVAPALEGVHSITDPSTDVPEVEHGSADERAALRDRRDLRDLRGRARDGARRAQPRARRHLHPLREGRPGRNGRAVARVLRGPPDGDDHGAARSARRQVRARRVGRRRRHHSGFLAKCSAFDENATPLSSGRCSSAAPSASIRASSSPGCSPA